MEGADQIGLAVVATTFAIVVVFAPVSFMGGIPGQFFKEFGITVVGRGAVLAAGGAAADAAAGGLFPEAHGRRRIRAGTAAVLSPRLDWALSHRWIIGRRRRACVFVASLVLAFGLPTGVQPPGNPDYYVHRHQGPPGATLADMQRIATRPTALSKRACRRPTEIFAQVGSVAGEGFGGGGGGAGLLVRAPSPSCSRPIARRTVSQIEDRDPPVPAATSPTPA